MRWDTGLAFMTIIMGATGVAQAQDMSQFERLKHHLLAGNRTISLLYASKCEQVAGDKHKSPDIIGGHVIGSFMNVKAPKETIMFSESHFTVRPDDTPTVEFVRYEVTPDEMATITVKMLSPKTYDPVAQTQTFHCKLGDGLRFAYDSWK